MGAVEKLKYTVDEYLELDKEGEKDGKRYEFHDGDTFIISDASIPHNQVLSGFSGALSQALKQRNCHVLTSTQKINVATRSFYCYPDIVVNYGKIETLEKHRDIITNPVVIIEVLSASTQNYDRGEKFRLYRTIPSLQEYICISSLEISLEKYNRGIHGFWTLKEYNNLQEQIVIDSLDITITLEEVYDKVDFELNEPIVN
jgi:Uma2 family endonuclease